jgi:hypothetical protein
MDVFVDIINLEEAERGTSRHWRRTRGGSSWIVCNGGLETN